VASEDMETLIIIGCIVVAALLGFDIKGIRQKIAGKDR
jgi:hypothetical protein